MKMKITMKPVIEFDDKDISSIWDVIYICQHIQEQTQFLEDQSYVDAATQIIEGLEVFIGDR